MLIVEWATVRQMGFVMERFTDEYRALCEVYSLTAESRINFLQGVKYFIGNNQDKNLEYSKYAGYGYKDYRTIDGIDVLKSKHRTSLGYVSTRSYQSEQLKNSVKSLEKRITVSI